MEIYVNIEDTSRPKSTILKMYRSINEVAKALQAMPEFQPTGNQPGLTIRIFDDKDKISAVFRKNTESCLKISLNL